MQALPHVQRSLFLVKISCYMRLRHVLEFSWELQSDCIVVLYLHDVSNHIKFRAKLEVQKHVLRFAFGYLKRKFVVFFSIYKSCHAASLCVLSYQKAQIPDVKYGFTSCNKRFQNTWLFFSFSGGAGNEPNCRWHIFGKHIMLSAFFLAQCVLFTVVPAFPVPRPAFNCLQHCR